MTRVGYFCSAGYTETAGMQEFLRKLAPDVDWKRCFPAVDKPAPKLGKKLPEPRRDHSGVSGQSLITRMLELLELHYSSKDSRLDFVVLIDDADCRFKDKSFADECARLHDQVRRATDNPDIGFVFLLASPEVEAWLLSDWSEGFGREYRSIEHSLAKRLEEHPLGPRPWNNIEEHGGKYINGCCEHKLSEQIQVVLQKLSESADKNIDPSLCYYSKKTHGGSMLRRVRPEKIGELCRSYFEPVRREIMPALEAIAILSS